MMRKCPTDDDDDDDDDVLVLRTAPLNCVTEIEKKLHKQNASLFQAQAALSPVTEFTA
jgi:hypothetical protein